MAPDSTSTAPDTTARHVSAGNRGNSNIWHIEERICEVATRMKHGQRNKSYSDQIAQKEQEPWYQEESPPVPLGVQSSELKERLL
jgi:hypothetical protein